MDRLVDDVLRDAQTGRGARGLSFQDFTALLVMARDRSFIISAVEGFQKEERGTLRARMDATFFFQDDRNEIAWDKKVLASVAFAQQVLNEVPDRDALTYAMWIST